MQSFLILRLQGMMQAWGGHTYEDYRPSHVFPTRSGLEGLLAACLGIDRDDLKKQQALSDSFIYAVRADKNKKYYPQKITDFHTVEKARLVTGKPNKNVIVSHREYLCDSLFFVGLAFQDKAYYDLETIIKAVKKPFYTPVLGRRSCPLTAPLYEDTKDDKSLHNALETIPPKNGWKKGIIYSELKNKDENAETESDNRLIIRDRRIFSKQRQFATRDVYIHHLKDS
jgi:CRISPR system Cascade subunit CasD